MKTGMGEYQILRVHSKGVLKLNTVAMIYNGILRPII